MNKRKVGMSKLCLKNSKVSSGVPKQISQFFASNEPSTSASTEISRPLVEYANIPPIVPSVPSIVNTLKAYEHTKDKMERLAKRKSDVSSPTIANFFDSANNASMADFEPTKRMKPTVKKPLTQSKTRRTKNSNQTSIKKLLQNNKTEESLFSELLAQQCATENVHPDELQMALALSRSLTETNSTESSQPNNLTAPKSPETRFSDIQKTLDNFGFKSEGQYSAGEIKTISRVNKNYKWRRKFSKRNLEYMRKPFEEKLSMIFTEPAVQHEVEHNNEYIVSSKMLREMRTRPEDSLFKLQSSDLHSTKLTDRYYIYNLFEISTVRSGYLLKNWNEIPGRTPSPDRHQQFNLSNITELSEEIPRQNIFEYPEFESDSEMPELNVETPVTIPVVSSTCNRDVESPDLFSDSEGELDEANKSKDEHVIEEDEANNSGIIHFENYTSEEAKIKDVIPSKLYESNVDIFADVSVDMIDLTSNCGSDEEDNATVQSNSKQSQVAVDRNVKNVSRQESVFTLSSETSLSETSVGLGEIRNLTESDTFLSNLTALVSFAPNHIEEKDINDNEFPASDPFNTEDITLVYSDDDKISERGTQQSQVNSSNPIVLLSDDSDDDNKSNDVAPKIPTNHDSIVSFIELPHFLENTLTEPLMDIQTSQIHNINNRSVFDVDKDVTKLTEYDTFLDSQQPAPVTVNHLEGDNIDNSPSNNNDTQNIKLIFSDDDDYNDNLSYTLKPTEEKSKLSNGYKTPPRQHAVLDISNIKLPNFNNQTELIQNLTANISDSIEISDDEINYSTAHLNPTTPTKTPEKSIEVDSDIESDSAIADNSNILEKSMHSFLRRYERKMSDDISIVEDENDENNEVNKSVNEFIFKSRMELTNKRPSSSKTLLKRFPSEPSFSRGQSKTPKKLCFDKLKTDDEFDRLVFGEKINHDVVIQSSDSPLRELPKTPEPPIEADFEDVNCPYNYFQPEEEFDIVLNQNTPKVNLNGSIDLNETFYEGDKYIYKTRNVTPEPDYKNMNINRLHVELKKYGLKKISRAKAIKLLEYIYNETHPIIQDTDQESTLDIDHHKIASSQPVKQTIKSPTKHFDLPTTSTELIGTWSGIDFSACDTNVDYFQKDNFSLNLLNTNEMIYLPSKPRSGKFQYCPLPLHISFFNLFRSNSKVRTAIFMYQPLEVEKLYLYFKSIGAKYEMNDLIQFLDRHCITFRTDPKNKTSGSRTKK